MLYSMKFYLECFIDNKVWFNPMNINHNLNYTKKICRFYKDISILNFIK